MSKWAFLLSILAVVCWGTGALFDKVLVQNIPPRIVFLVRSCIMFILILPFVIAGWGENRVAIEASGRIGMVAISLSALLTTIGVFSYFYALSLSEASKVVPLTSTYPLVAVLLVLVFLGEPFTLAKLIGTVLVVAGIACLVF